MELSIIIPVYNNKSYLNDCINSVLNLKAEYIIIDDGSTDGSGELCDILSQKYKNVKVFHTANKGVSSARNLGIQNSTGSYIYFLDSDDICFSYNFPILDGTSDIFIGTYSVGTPKHNCIKHHAPSYDINDIPKSYLKEELSLCVGSVILNRKLVVSNDIKFPEDIKYGEDKEFFLKCVALATNPTIIDRPLCLYRSNLDSAMYKPVISRFDVAISQIRMIEYFKNSAPSLSIYLKEVVCLDTLISVCEGLFRYKVKYNVISGFLNNNSEIKSFLDNSNFSEDSQSYIKLKSITTGLRKIQLKVLIEKFIYQTRCKASLLKSKITRIIKSL